MSKRKDKMPDKHEIVFFREDVEKTSGSVAWFRLPKEMKDFIQLCVDKHDGIDAIVLTRDSDDPDGKIHWNIGFSLQNPERSDN